MMIGQISPMPESRSPDANRARNADRTYDWLHKGLPIGAPQYSDEEVAAHVRMLMRDDLHHEAICTIARDRIMCLVKEKAALQAEIETLKALTAEEVA